jgi:hypothetical protein
LKRQNLARQPANSGLVAKNQEISVSGKMRGGGRSHYRTGLRLKFPGNREKYRENDELGLLWAHRCLKKALCDGHFLRNSLSNRTGKLERLNREIIFDSGERPETLNLVHFSHACF